MADTQRRGIFELGEPLIEAAGPTRFHPREIVGCELCHPFGQRLEITTLEPRQPVRLVDPRRIQQGRAVLKGSDLIDAGLTCQPPQHCHLRSQGLKTTPQRFQLQIGNVRIRNGEHLSCRGKECPRIVTQ